ncbi:MAG: helix-turn-helix transcriptional regulator [Firmicutes bacterium]|nr:helix-turn-helix transcriptional regulator [Bacillota bacterium]
MLKEKIAYKDELPVNVITANIKEYPIHFHDEIEVVFVLSGSISLRVGYYDYDLEQGDVFIINDKEMHSYTHHDEDNMVMMLHLDPSYFSRYYEDLRNTFFITDTEDKNDRSLNVLKSLLAHIMMEILQKGVGYEQKVIENTHNLIACLMSDFQFFSVEGDKFVNQPRKRGNKILASRLSRITNYIYDNYSRKLTLNEIAENEHLSIYYLSHVIKEATGLSFQDLLSFIRVEQSEHLLLGTDKKMGAIAHATGFSAVRYYIKHFERWFGMTPQEYRKKYTGKAATRETAAVYEKAQPAEIEKMLRKRVKGIGSQYINSYDTNSSVIDIDILEEYEVAGKKDKKENFLESLLNIGSSKIAPAIEPYNILQHLEETVIKDEPNFLITTPSRFPDTLTCISILVFNFDEKFKRAIDAVRRNKDILDVVKSYDEESEILFRCNGLSGDFSIARYRLSKDNIVAAYEEAMRAGSNRNNRAKVLGKWHSLPAVEFSSLSASGTLSIRSAIRGLGAELILIDRK